MTKAIADTLSVPEYIEIGFIRGIPTTINGEPKNPVELIEQLNLVAGNHGIGRIDMIENRLVGKFLLKGWRFVTAPWTILFFLII